MTDIENLRKAVSTADASLRDLTNPDPDIRIEAVIDFAGLMSAAKAVVLAA